MAVSGGPSIVKSNLVLCLDAADVLSYPRSGATWFDLSGNGNNGTLQNSPTYSASNAGFFTFNGTNQYVSSMAIGYRNFTFSIWFKTTSTASNGNYYARPCLFGQESGGVGVGDGAIAINGGNIAPWSGLNGDQAVSGVAVNDGNWRQVVWLSNGSTVFTYLNNVLQSNLNMSVGRAFNGVSFNIAASGGVGGGFLACSIAQVLVHSRALDARELRQNFDSGRVRFDV